jgi:ATP-dependent Clp protease ATP-binding subunit ClpA
MFFPMSYFFWHYAKGLVSVFSAWLNIFRAFLHIFGVGELLMTLVSPWKRDVTPKTWIGFQPLATVNRLLMNAFSRMMGAIVRSIVIAVGVVVLGITVVVGAAFVIVWFLSVPVFLFLLFQLSARGDLWRAEQITLLVSGIGTALSLLSYVSRLPTSFLPENRDDLFRMAYFPRVLGRLGIRKKDFRSADWGGDDAFAKRLSELNISAETFDDIVAYEAAAAERRVRRSKPFLWENLRKSVPISRGWKYGYTVKLDRYCTDLSKSDFSEYSRLHLFGREDEFRVTTLVMARPQQNSVFLVGDAGIGKKTFVHSLARKIREGDLPAYEHLRFLVFDLGTAVGDAMNRDDDVENALRVLFMQAAYAGNVVLVIDHIDTFLGGDPNHQNLAPLFSEFLALPTFRVIGLIGAGKYHDLARTDEPALKFFEAIYLREPDETATREILLNVLEPEERSGVLFTWKALQSIVELSGQYEWDVPYPEKALDLAQETLLHYRASPDGSFITPATVQAFVSIKTGVPVGNLGEDEKDRLLRLEEIMHARVVGQSDAVRQVAESMRRARAGFGNPKRPLGSFLFLGPTGVGKTETAKALAEAYFGGEDRMVRIDMSEFQGPDAAERLIGSSVSGEEGQLTAIMKEHPFSVLLLDEIEKAYPKALDIFLQVIDEGFVTDGFGRKINFRKCIIIATSNASSALIAELLGHGATPEQAKKEVVADIAKQGTFRMEFMNRFDGLVFFSSLLPAELSSVVSIKLAGLAARIKKEKNITLSFGEGVAEAVVSRGYEPEFGARSLNRYLEDKVEDLVVRKVLTGAVKEGGSCEISVVDLL